MIPNMTCPGNHSIVQILVRLPQLAEQQYLSGFTYLYLSIIEKQMTSGTEQETVASIVHTCW